MIVLTWTDMQIIFLWCIYVALYYEISYLVVLFCSSHYDLNELWTMHQPFAVDVFVMVVKTMPTQDRYKAMQALVNHLDAMKDSSCEVKEGILDTLSHCVAAAADGNLGTDCYLTLRITTLYSLIQVFIYKEGNL